MKKYFYHDGQDQVGPFELEELKQKQINRDTLIWFEGIEDWTKASKLPELEDFFPKTPPPVNNINNEKISNSLYISNSILEELPAMVRNELSSMSAQKQEEFVEEFKRKRKSVGIGYLFILLVFSTHYGYVNKWGMQVLFWLTGGGLFIWWIVDLFRIPSMVRNYNKDIATDIMRNLKAISR